MLAGVPSTSPSAASTSEAVAPSAARRTTSTPVISGSVAPRSTASNSSEVAGDGVWCTISSVGTPASVPRPGSEHRADVVGDDPVQAALDQRGNRPGRVARAGGPGDQRGVGDVQTWVAVHPAVVVAGGAQGRPTQRVPGHRVGVAEVVKPGRGLGGCLGQLAEPSGQGRRGVGK